MTSSRRSALYYARRCMCTRGDGLDEVGKARIEKGSRRITLMQQRIAHIADSALRTGTETGLVKVSSHIAAHAFLSFIQHPFTTALLPDTGPRQSRFLFYDPHNSFVMLSYVFLLVRVVLKLSCVDLDADDLAEEWSIPCIGWKNYCMSRSEDDQWIREQVRICVFHACGVQLEEGPTCWWRPGYARIIESIQRLLLRFIFEEYIIQGGHHSVLCANIVSKLDLFSS